jgi:hypothetical protein
MIGFALASDFQFTLIAAFQEAVITRLHCGEFFNSVLRR